MKIYRESDVDKAQILHARVAVIGYGNQGHAHALNLRDSGVDVRIGARIGGGSAIAAQEAGFTVLPIMDATAWADVVMLTVPDTAMPSIYQEQIEQVLTPEKTLLFAHGFCIHFGLIRPPIPSGLISPKGPGKTLRERFVAGAGLPALVAASTPACLRVVMAYAWGIGSARIGLYETTFEEETVTDLFGEQAVLCGGIPELIKAAFETLVNAGYSPEVAYFECMHEAKLITDLLLERGFEGMREAISDTAEWGGYVSGPRLIDEGSKAEMKEILAEIQGGSFAKTLEVEAANGFEELRRRRHEEAQSLLEKTWQKTHVPTKPISET